MTERLEKTALVLLEEMDDEALLLKLEGMILVLEQMDLTEANNNNGKKDALGQVKDVGNIVTGAVNAMEKTKQALDMWRKGHEAHKVHKARLEPHKKSAKGILARTKLKIASSIPDKRAAYDYGTALLHIAAAITAAHQTFSVLKGYQDERETHKRKKDESNRKRKEARAKKKANAGSLVITTKYNKHLSQKREKK